VRDARRGMRVDDEPSRGGVSVTVDAGTPWDVVAARAVDEGWVGIEALSGIPGSTGATPVQNVGAYGQEVAETIASVRAWDRAAGEVRTLAAGDLGFAYRDSLLKRSIRGDAGDGAEWRPTPRFVVLDVTFRFARGDLSAPIAYPGLARALDVAVGERAPLRAARDAVLGLRRSKGMVLDEADHDTWSVGSFFVNPVLESERAAGLPDEAPRYPVDGGSVKTSAAWLIERAGFEKGFALEGSRAGLSTKHALALTNRGDAAAADVLALARAVRDGVREVFGVELRPEPTLVGVEI
jgi:UDP-N-acetylmuramate dehydrogenase